MKFIADLHIHSKYSRATSPLMDLENLDKWAGIKGIKVLGTGDFTHPEWFKQIKEKLEPAEVGLFKLKKTDSEIRFILTAEISCIYSKGGRVRKIHIIVIVPCFETVKKINTYLGKIGNLKADGRPILGLDAKKLAKIVLDINSECLIIPAHCLLPNTYLHSNPDMKKIKDISVGDKVFTHKGRLRKVKKIYKRYYKGKVYNIKPYNFRIGLKTTSEHPFYIIKSYKDCKNCSHIICKPTCDYYQKRGCSHAYFKEYKPEWVQAKDVEKGDILIFPRFNRQIKDTKEIKLSKYLKKSDYKIEKGFIKPIKYRGNFVPNIIKINKDFCRLMGYYLSEGYTDNRDSISFCFNRNEEKYIGDLKFLMDKIFNLSSPRIYKRKNTNSIEIIYFSKVLAKTFSKFFYNNSTTRRAYTKCLPSWVLDLSIEKQVEIFKSWWYGDAGGTSSRFLMNQMKIICLRLGIIPSITIQSKDDFNKGMHKIGDRVITANYDIFQFSGLSFFEHGFDLLKDPCFRKFNTKLTRRHGWIDEKNIYIPVRNIEIENYEGKVYNLEVEDDNSYLSEFATVHNCMTPWFAIFGSKSGFDSLEECFEDYTKHIFAVETGLSADPKMLWRNSGLDKITLISNSDAHSLPKLGREANVFETELSYSGITEAIKTKNPLKFLYTIEFYPQEGRYHNDGHRSCDINLSPQESKKYNNICPVCGKPLTIGVLNRIEKLADRPARNAFDIADVGGEKGSISKGVIPFKSLIPLAEIIAEVLGQGVGTKRVTLVYENLIEKFGTELEILLNISRRELEANTLPKVAQGIIRVREGRVNIVPGYDGVYGKVRIFSK